MNYLITGGTGFVGKKLVKKLHEEQHHTYILTRSPESYKDTEKATYIGYDVNASELPAVDGVVNLAGESLFGYWTKQRKKNILNSRIETTRKLLGIISQLKNKPNVLVSGSAVGYYGMSDELIFTEKTHKSSEDFLGTVTNKWENTAKEAEHMGLRTVLTRFGVILGKGGGALPLMGLPVKLFVGGEIGDGEQWVSWVHIDDVVNLIIFCLENEEVSGPVNVTAPEPKRNKDFMKTLAQVLHRPYWFTTPTFLIQTALGEMSQLITKGQYVWPAKAINANYQFIYPKLRETLKSLN